jgi:hypothetical protein
MRTKDFVAAIEAGMQAAYPVDGEQMGFITVPYSKGEIVGECLGVLLLKNEHFAVIVAHAAHWVVKDPDALFNHDEIEGDFLDDLEDFYNIVGGMHTAPYMQWTCVYFPGLTEEQILSGN